MTEESPDARVSENADADETTERATEGESGAAADAAANGEPATDATGEPVADANGEPDAASDGERRTDADDGASDLAARVAEYDEDLAEDVSALESRVRELEADLDDSETRADELTERLKRTQADFQNYKKRSKEKQEQIRERATEDFVERVVPVRDNLVRALDQDEDADIRPGVESTLEEFDRVLADENVSTIDPDPGEAVDPTRHEVLMRVDSDHPEGTVDEVFQPGYEMAENVVREAQVTVSTGDEE